MSPLVAETLQRLRALADPERARFGAGYHPTVALVLGVSAPGIQGVARPLRDRLVGATAPVVVDLASALIDTDVFEARQVATLLLSSHKATRAGLDLDTVVTLGQGMDNWVSVDTFGTLVVGAAVRRGTVTVDHLLDWTRSSDLWWRRCALVATTGWNKRSYGGRGEVDGTLRVCAALVADREDLIVKALSWALRELVLWDPARVRAFLDAQPVAARVRREVGNKLRTGLKRG